MALDFANKASAKHDPPLAPCYKLTGCGPSSDSGDPSHFWECSGVESTDKTIYTCEGFRLPTEAEWEYAARAGTTTAFYSGDITAHDNVYDPCVLPDPNLDDIAWTCLNSGDNWPRKLHPGGTKKPNGWGLHDMLGSVEEWLNDSFNGLGHGTEPLTDPFGVPVPGPIGQTRGGSAVAWSIMCRAAHEHQAPKYGMCASSGFRLVRTIH
jgi:formylglycine-generating enzyme required for sulfatase activity